MTDRIAIWIAAIVILFIALDLTLGFGAGVFLLRKIAQFTEFLAFWR